MTRFQALFIKYLRIRKEGTWRWISDEYIKRYKEYPFAMRGGLDGPQVNGFNLCNEAMDVLNEKVEDGWN